MKLKIENFSITPSEIVVGTEGSYGSTVLDCEFDEAWDGLIKKASFFTASDSVSVLFANSIVRVPDEVMEKAGEYDFVLSGHDGSRSIISVTGRLIVLPTLAPTVTPSGSPTPSEINQIYTMMRQAVSATEGAAEAATSATAAADSAYLAASQAQSAEEAAREAAARALDAARNLPLDRFAATDGTAFQEGCRSSFPPELFGQIMVGPGGRVFVSILGHTAKGNPYGAWLPLIDDSGACPEASTYSAKKITALTDGVSRNVTAMQSRLSSEVASLRESLSEKADMVDGCIKMNGYNVMGYMRTLTDPEDDPAQIQTPGFYAVINDDPWKSSEMPGYGVGLLEVLPAAGGMCVQKFYSIDGDCYFRVRDLVHADPWQSWKKLN